MEEVVRFMKQMETRGLFDNCLSLSPHLTSCVSYTHPSIPERA